MIKIGYKDLKSVKINYRQRPLSTLQLKYKVRYFYQVILIENGIKNHLQTYRSLNYRTGQNSPTISNPAIPIPLILYPMNYSTSLTFPVIFFKTC